MIRGLPDEVYAAVRIQARAQGRSAEAQMRAILERAALPEGRFKLGSALARIGERVGGVELEMLRDQRRRRAP